MSDTDKNGLPRKHGGVDVAGFLPPLGVEPDRPSGPEFDALVTEVKRLRKPPQPLKVLRTAEGWRLADEGSWLRWSACQCVGTGISVVSADDVEVVVPESANSNELDVGPPLDEQATLPTGPLPSAGVLRKMASELGLDLDGVLPEKHPKKVEKQAAWELVRAASRKQEENGNAVAIPDQSPRAENDAGASTADGSEPEDEIQAVSQGPQMLRLADIILDPEVQSRTQIDADVVEEYAEKMREGTRFPPIVVFLDGEDLRVADGFHRVEAARLAGLDDIEADVRSGSRRDAVLHAVGANSTHGLRRTNADKRRAVQILLDDPEWTQWSAREIARRAGVSHVLVGRLRSGLSGNGYQIGPKIVSRGGSVYEMNVGGKSAQQAAEPALEVESEVSDGGSPEAKSSDSDENVGFVEVGEVADYGAKHGPEVEAEDEPEQEAVEAEPVEVEQGPEPEDEPLIETEPEPVSETVQQDDQEGDDGAAQLARTDGPVDAPEMPIATDATSSPVPLGAPLPDAPSPPPKVTKAALRAHYQALAAYLPKSEPGEALKLLEGLAELAAIEAWFGGEYYELDLEALSKLVLDNLSGWAKDDEKAAKGWAGSHVKRLRALFGQ